MAGAASGPAAGPGIGPTPLPGWLGPIVTVTTQVGVPTVFAAVLLWFVLFKVNGVLENIERAEDNRVKIVAAMQDSLIGALDRQTRSFEQAMKENIAANQRHAEDAKRDRETFLQRFTGSPK